MAKRILIVEDEEDNLMLIMQILKMRLGQNEKDLFVARDGHEAMRLAYEHEPDLILMDLTLPKLTGWEATRSLKADEKFKDTPILALTAHAMVGDRERALRIGCDDYYPKPINLEDFETFMRPYLLGD